MLRNRDALAATPAHALAVDCLDAGIEAARPERVVRDQIRLSDDALVVDGARYDLTGYDSVLVFGGGNAAGGIASALEAVLGDRLDGGLVVTDAPAATERVAVRAGDHPLPTERNAAATRDLLGRARDAADRTLVLAVVTGGASALLAAPAPGVSLDSLRTTTDRLLRSGAPIHDVNAVRKHLSAVKGGRLAAALAPATVVTLAVSDVVGNDLDAIGSGPTVPDTSTLADARRVLAEHDIDAPVEVRESLTAAAAETPGGPFEHVSTHVLADGWTALDAARAVAADAGYETHVHSATVTGSARAAARDHVALADRVRETGTPVSPPAVVLSAGECTVAVDDSGGRGGPNQEFALAAALDGAPGVLGAVDTDGIDGNTDAAGALVDADTVDDPDAAGAALDAHDAHSFLADRDALVRTGATGTNVNDLRVLVL
ncbi:glycerate kinase [Salarchaeum sp. JOR-1]|uniref:glycerate kinase type-2 family protein n=1 Tax=Salarchaeum sp. JOR-1 TaxID=2599399 RepID=UPI0011989510|nr:DUF4147 domain-containing protein [Salarchaeum sp. JOR-1]QDX39711.1 DUF4147 domain-containing protein [Salarchaeum sp. JOR-1]